MVGTKKFLMKYNFIIIKTELISNNPKAFTRFMNI